MEIVFSSQFGFGVSLGMGAWMLFYAINRAWLAFWGIMR